MRTSPRKQTLADAVLRVPLVAKIVGANAVIVLVMVAVCLTRTTVPFDNQWALPLGLALAASVVISAMMVGLALRPLADLEETATRVRRGDLAARVPDSRLADSDLRRIGLVVNDLLESVAQDRARLRELTTLVIRAGDRERAYIARELHDGTAQTLTALILELSVLSAENRDVAQADRIERVRKIVGDVLDEVRALAHVVHPRVLDDLGLSAALRHLARETSLAGSVRVIVEGDAPNDAVGVGSAATLYRVAQEAVGNAVRHGRPATITLRLDVTDGMARVEVEDDGVGFNPEEAERARPGMGLFTMKERAALVGGRIDLHSSKGRGTRVVATVPSAPDAPLAIATSTGRTATNEANNDW